MKVSSQQLLRYPGGKYRARKILDEYVPHDIAHVLSPFFGGGSYEMFLTQKNIQVTAFDGFPVLAIFWHCVLENPNLLARKIRGHGDIDQPIFKSMQTTLKAKESYSPSDDLYDYAAQFFIVNRCSFSGTTLSGGYSQESKNTRFTESSITRVETFKNHLLSVNMGLFEESLCNIDKTVDFLFLDPPYLMEKSKNKLYGIGGDMHQHFNHEDLFRLVKESNLPFTLTYNNSDEIKEMWKEYNVYPAEWSYGMNKSKESSEIVITNHNVAPIL